MMMQNFEILPKQKRTGMLDELYRMNYITLYE